jgi:hypothetical protein
MHPGRNPTVSLAAPDQVNLAFPTLEQIDIGPSAPIRDVHPRVQAGDTPGAVIQVFRVVDGDRARLNCGCTALMRRR